MLQRYDVKSRRDVVDGRVSAQDAVNEFMTMWGKLAIHLSLGKNFTNFTPI